MANTGASDRFAASLSKLKLGAKDIQTVSQAMRDYAKSSNMAADASQWTKADIANIRNWERDKISALRAVKREQVAFNRSLASGGVRGGGAPGGGAKGTRAHGEGGGWSVGAIAGGAWAGGLGTMAAGYGAYAATKHAIHAGAEYQHEQIALKNAGRSMSEMRDIEARARDVAKQVPTSTYTENLKTINETTGAFGDLHHALENLTFMAKAASILKNAAGDKIQADAGEIGNKFARFFEMRGTAGNTETFQREAGEMIRPMVFTRGNFNPDEMLNFAQQAKSSLQNYDLRFMSKILPALVTEIGGERSGTAANAFTNVILGKVHDKSQTKAWEKYKLINPKEVIEGKGGALSWKAGAVYDTDMALRDPLRYMEERQLPALKKGGVNIDDPLELTKILNQLYRNSNANLMANLVGQLRNRQRLHKDERNIEQAGTADQIYDRNVTSDPTVAVSKLSAAWENLGASVTMALPIAEGINKLAALMAAAPEKFKPAVDTVKKGSDLASDILDNSPLAKAEREAREKARKEGRKATVGDVLGGAWKNIKESWTPGDGPGAFEDYDRREQWKKDRERRAEIYANPQAFSPSAGIAAPVFAGGAMPHQLCCLGWLQCGVAELGVEDDQ
jgi:hypothetical protein